MTTTKNLGREGGAFTEAQVVAAGRALADNNAKVCNVNKDDNWKLYGDQFVEEARLCLAAALATPAPTDTGTRQAESVERQALEAILNKLDPHRDAVLWGIASEALGLGKLSDLAGASGAGEVKGQAAADRADAERFWEKAIAAEAVANDLRRENEILRSALRAVVDSPLRCVAIAEAALNNE